MTTRNGVPKDGQMEGPLRYKYGVKPRSRGRGFSGSKGIRSRWFWEPDPGDEALEKNFSTTNKPGNSARRYYKYMTRQLREQALERTKQPVPWAEASDDTFLLWSEDEQESKDERYDDDVEQVKLNTAEIKRVIEEVRQWLCREWHDNKRPQLVESARKDRAKVSQMRLERKCLEESYSEVYRLRKRIETNVSRINTDTWMDKSTLMEHALRSLETDVYDMLENEFWVKGLIDAKTMEHSLVSSQTYKPSIEALVKMIGRREVKAGDSEDIRGPPGTSSAVAAIVRQEKVPCRRPRMVSPTGETDLRRHQADTLIAVEQWSTPPQEPHIGPPTTATDRLRFHINDTREDEAPLYINSQTRLQIMDHQIEGIRFMWQRIVQEEDGGLLLHKMGLGKTMQVITLLVAIAEAVAAPETRDIVPRHLRNMRALVLCPASVVDNWAEEFSRWTPRTRDSTHSYLGPVVKIQSRMPAQQRYHAIRRWAQSPGVLLLGYEMFMHMCRDMDGSKDTLCGRATLVVADEVHRLKSESGVRAFASSIKTPSRLGLTGTPLTNNVADIYQVLTWASRKHSFGQLNVFRDKYDTPIRKGSYSDSTAEQVTIAQTQLRRFQQLLAPFIDRKTVQKELSSRLPPKKEFHLSLAPSEVQATLYNEYLQAARGAGSIGQAEVWKILYDLNLMLAHPSVLKATLSTQPRTSIESKEPPEEESGTEDEDEVQADTAEWPDGGSSHTLARAKVVTSLAALDSDDPASSNKIVILCAILDQARRLGEKVLVFSQRLRTLNYLEALCRSQGRKVYILQGKTMDRQQLVSEFNTDQSAAVFLVSTKAGGTGLNIHGATRVIIFDFKYAPTTEEIQAIARAHRIGQKRPV